MTISLLSLSIIQYDINMIFMRDHAPGRFEMGRWGQYLFDTKADGKAVLGLVCPSRPVAVSWREVKVDCVDGRAARAPRERLSRLTHN